MSRKNFRLTTIAILSCTAAQLSADMTHVQIGTGYRQDSITLNVKERGTLNPRAKSNRHFKDLEIVTVGGRIRNTLGCCSAYVRASFDYGFVLDGKVRDELTLTDRNEIDQFHHSGFATEGNFSRSIIHNTVKDNSFVWDFDLAFGYPINCGCDDLEFAPAIGFSLNRQQLHVKGRASFEDASLSDISSERIRNISAHGKGSSFRTSWWGPWLGFDFAYNSPDCWNLYGSFEFHFGRARRQVNAHTGSCYFDSYRRTKTFYGPLFRLGTNYMFCENWYADANVSYQKFYSNNNRDHISWSSGQLRLDLGYVF